MPIWDFGAVAEIEHTPDWLQNSPGVPPSWSCQRGYHTNWHLDFLVCNCETCNQPTLAAWKWLSYMDYFSTLHVLQVFAQSFCSLMIHILAMFLTLSWNLSSTTIYLWLSYPKWSSDVTALPHSAISDLGLHPVLCNKLFFGTNQHPYSLCPVLRRRNKSVKVDLDIFQGGFEQFHARSEPSYQ